MIAFENHAEGTILPVRARAGARHDALRGEQGGQLKAAVTQVAEKGKANEAIIDLLAKRLLLKRSQIVLLAGLTSSQKKFLIRGLGREELAARLQQALAGAKPT